MRSCPGETPHPPRGSHEPRVLSLSPLRAERDERPPCFQLNERRSVAFNRRDVRALRRVCLEEIVLSASNFPEPTARGVRAMSFESFLASIEAPALREVALYWQEARGSRRMPGWKDIDPAAIARHLPIVWSWKYDRHTDTFTGRLAGEEINEVFGKSLRGVPMKEFFADWQYDLIFARHRRVVTEPAFAHGV